MGFGKPIDDGQSLGRKNLAESLKLARLRGVGFPVREDRHHGAAVTKQPGQRKAYHNNVCRYPLMLSRFSCGIVSPPDRPQERGVRGPEPQIMDWTTSSSRRERLCILSLIQADTLKPRPLTRLTARSISISCCRRTEHGNLPRIAR